LKVKIINKPFLGIISATRISSKRRRAMVSRLPIRFAFFAISAILLLSGFLAIHSNQSAWAGTFPGPNGQIAFSSNRDGNFEIYTMSEDGSDETGLREDAANDFDPSWSPDGDKIAFVSDRDSTGDIDEPGDITAICSMNADDGSDVTRLTDNDADDREPDWGTNTSTPGDDDDGDDDKNKHDSKKKHHDDNAKKKH
jgi:dipeptidyl aminopeptidase/acylaminoacyl peptidase